MRGGSIWNLEINRKILEEECTVNEAFEIVEKLRGKATGSAIMVADGNAVAVIDVYKDISCHINITGTGFIVRTNHWRGIVPSLAGYEAHYPSSSSKHKYLEAYSYLRI